MRVIIAGAGIAGLSVAHALIALGVRPLLIARDHGATINGAGIVSSQFWDRELLPYAKRSQQIIRGLVPVHQCGMAQIALSEQTRALLEQIEEPQQPLPADVQSTFSKSFARQIEHAVFSPHDFWVSNHELLCALSKNCDLVSAEIQGIEEGAVITEKGTFSGDHVVVALGSESTQIEIKRISMLGGFDCRLPCIMHVMDTGVYLRPESERSLVGDGDAPWSPGAIPSVSPVFLSAMAAELGILFGERFPVQAVSAGVLSFTVSRRPILQQEGPNWHITGFGEMG